MLQKFGERMVSFGRLLLIIAATMFCANILVFAFEGVMWWWPPPIIVFCMVSGAPIMVLGLLICIHAKNRGKKD